VMIPQSAKESCARYMTCLIKPIVLINKEKP
jgi:hypothetical protein